MPFQSEKQRRYLWANEPEIARDWTDTYGSGIAKALGGRIGFQEGGFGNWLGDATGYTQHNINNQLLKDALASNQINEEQYKTMGGYDVAQNMPNFMQNKMLPVGLASLGYQGIKKGAGILDKLGWVDDTMGMSKYGDIGALGSIGLNMQGAQGLSPNDLALYSNIMNPRSAFQDDANYIPRQTMARNWSELDDAEAQNIDAQRQMELARLSGMEQYPTEEEDEEGNWLTNLLSPQRIGRTALSYLGNKAGLGMGLGMITGPLGWAGAGLAGLGNRLRGGVSQNAFEQAREARRHQARIDNMLARKKAGKSYSQKNLNQLTMNQGPAGITPKPPRGPVGPPPGGGPHGNGGGGGGFSGAGAGTGASGPPGRNYNIGGLAGLWQR